MEFHVARSTCGKRVPESNLTCPTFQRSKLHHFLRLFYLLNVPFLESRSEYGLVEASSHRTSSDSACARCDDPDFDRVGPGVCLRCVVGDSRGCPHRGEGRGSFLDFPTRVLLPCEWRAGLPPFEQKYRRLGSTGRCLEGVDVKIFMEDEEMPHEEVSTGANRFSEAIDQGKRPSSWIGPCWGAF